jgi:hypothetical protein
VDAVTPLPLPPLALAGRLAMVLGLAIFFGLAFEWMGVTAEESRFRWRGSRQ